MQEDMLLKLVGWAGAAGLVGQAVNGIWRTYRERYAPPPTVVYRFDDEKDDDATVGRGRPQQSKEKIPSP